MLRASSLVFLLSTRAAALRLAPQTLPLALRHAADLSTFASRSAAQPAFIGSLRPRSRPISASADDLSAQIQATVAAEKVVVYSKSYCPFCTKTKSLFSGLGVDFKVIELDELAEGDSIQAALLDITKQRTVPNVFVGGQHLGGNDGKRSNRHPRAPMLTLSPPPPPYACYVCLRACAARACACCYACALTMPRRRCRFARCRHAEGRGVGQVAGAAGPAKVVLACSTFLSRFSVDRVLAHGS